MGSSDLHPDFPLIPTTITPLRINPINFPSAGLLCAPSSWASSCHTYLRLICGIATLSRLLFQARMWPPEKTLVRSWQCGNRPSSSPSHVQMNCLLLMKRSFQQIPVAAVCCRTSKWNNELHFFCFLKCSFSQMKDLYSHIFFFLLFFFFFQLSLKFSTQNLGFSPNFHFWDQDQIFLFAIRKRRSATCWSVFAVVSAGKQLIRRIREDCWLYCHQRANLPISSSPAPPPTPWRGCIVKSKPSADGSIGAKSKPEPETLPARRTSCRVFLTVDLLISHLAIISGSNGIGEN